VLGDHALDLHKQSSLRVIEGRGVSEAHRHVVAGQFVEDEDLVSVGTGQTVRREAPDGVEDARFSGVAQRVEARAVQAGT